MVKNETLWTDQKNLAEHQLQPDRREPEILHGLCSLTTEPWGVRRLGVADPNRVAINVMSHHNPGNGS